MNKLILICLMLSMQCFGWNDQDYTLLWQVTETGNTVDGNPDLYTFLGIDHSNDELGVRIAAYNANGDLIRYLNPAYELEDHTSYIDWDYNDQMIGTRDDIWMTRASQAYYGPSDYMEYLYQMQIGTYDNDYNFIELLYSNAENVPGKYWYDWGTLGPSGDVDWIPTEFYTVNPVVPVIPEPNVSILFLLGCSMLFLKRKENI